MVEYAAPWLQGMEYGWTQSLERLGEVATALDTSDCEIAHTRIFNAPVSRVYEMWTNPRHLAQWWGPHGFRTTVLEMDVRTGGLWRLIMRGPDGTDYPNKMIYREVVSNERLVYTNTAEGVPGAQEFTATATFKPQDGKTSVTVRMIFRTAEARNLIAE